MATEIRHVHGTELTGRNDLVLLEILRGQQCGSHKLVDAVVGKRERDFMINLPIWLT
jgi:hypothetical protein